MNAKVVEVEAMGTCDKCTVAAGHVRLSGPNGELVFCAHHYNGYKVPLFKQGYTITTDTRDSLTIRIVSGSPE